MKTYILLVACAVSILTSCKDQVQKKQLQEAENSIELVQTIKNPAQGNSSTPSLFTAANNQLYMSWVTKQDKVAQLYFSILKDNAWTDVQLVAKGNNWFNNWADFPTIVANNGNIFTNYLEKSAPDTYTYDIKVNIYNQETKTWQKNILLHNDGTKSEHGFVSATPANDAGFFVSWLDGRNTTASHEEHTHTSEGAMTLRGAFVDTNGNISGDTELDSRVCDCCQTSSTMTTSGPVVVYRDRDENEVRDISIVRYENEQWTSPQKVFNDNWEIGGCPVNGPAVAAINNTLAVVWYTESNDTPKVFISFSKDGGVTFEQPIKVNANPTLGRVGLVMLNEEEAIVTWMETIEKETFVQLMKVNQNGAKGEVITLSNTSAERSSGFPQIALMEGKIYAAMTITAASKDSYIKTVTVDLKNL